MDEELRFNICNIDKPVLNSTIPDLPERIRSNLSEALQYSTVFWYTHLQEKMDRDDKGLEESIRKLISTKKLLWWLECLSLLGTLTAGILSLV